MPKYGLLTNPTHDVVKEIREFARLGFDYAEIGIEEPCGSPKILRSGKREILAALKRNNMFAVGHTAYWVDFGSLHKNVRRGWIDEGKEMIDVASQLRMGYLNFHFFPGNSMGRKIPEGRRLYIRNFAAAMKELCAYAKRKNVTLMLENIPKGRRNPYGIDDFNWVIKSAPGLMVHLDVAHAFIEGGNKRIDEYIRRFSSKLAHIHMSDNNGKEDEHIPLGKGKINFKRVAKSLKRINYDKTITFEVFTSDLDAKRSTVKFQRLWKRA